MSTQKADVGIDFATALAKSQERPQAEQQGRDLPEAFPFNPPADHKMVDTTDDDPLAITGAIKYRYKIHRKVFTIYRPWEGCSRCKDDIANTVVTLPDVGDYECPHITRSDYEKIADDILAGRLVMGAEQEVVQRDGTIVVSLRWYEPILNKKQLRERAKRMAIGGGQREEPPL
jgi:hypothetical protein